MRRVLLLALVGACSFSPPDPKGGGDDDDVDAAPSPIDAPDGTIDAAIDGPAGNDCQAIAFRSSASATAGSGSSVSVTTPDGVVAGDVLVATVLFEADSDEPPGSLAPPTGWTFVRRDRFSSDGSIGQDMYVRVAAVGETASHRFQSSGGSKRFVAAIHAYTGVDTANPVLDHAGQTITSTTAIAAPSVNAAECSMIVGGFGIHVVTSFTAPAQMTERLDVSNGSGADITLATADEVATATAATGARTATASDVASAIGQLLALRPAP